LLAEAARHLESLESIASAALLSGDPDFEREALEHGIRSSARARRLLSCAVHVDLERAVA
jgi:hypothetical protein